MRSNKLAKQYMDVSTIDWLGPFSNLWVGFNCWYKALSPGLGDLQGVLKVAEHVKARKAFEDDMEYANEIDPFIRQQLRDYATVKTAENTTSYRDTTGTEFRLLCENTNPVIDFLELAQLNPALKQHCKGVAFLKPGEDELFKYLYLNYKKMMTDRMWESFDAHSISTELQGMGVNHYGRLLIHDLQTVGSSPIGDLNYLFGAGYSGLLTRIRNKTRSQLRRELRNINNSVIWSCKLVEGGDPFKRYLLVLYKFRSAYFHGNLDPSNSDTQLLACNAYLSLRSIMEKSI